MVVLECQDQYGGGMFCLRLETVIEATNKIRGCAQTLNETMHPDRFP